MNAKVLVVILFFVTNFKLCQGKNYTNYMLVQIIPIKHEHLKFFRSLEHHKYIDVSFWSRHSALGRPVQMIINPTDIGLFRERATHFNFTYDVLIPDIQKAFNEQEIKAYHSRMPHTFSFEHYHTLEDIYMWLNDVSNNRTYVGKQISIGNTAEGRNIPIININYDTYKTKPKVIVEGGIHGHEWSSVAFVTYLINELGLAGRSKNFQWKQFARSYDWYLLPVANPDGYDYTHKVDRLWRKNKRRTEQTIHGVDLNRNFDETFGVYSSSSNPTDDNYCGPKAFSEPETRALATFIRSKSKDLSHYFSIHAYGQKIVIPYDTRVKHMENFGEMENYSRQAISKLYGRSRVKYSTGTSYDTSGNKVSGTSASWVKKEVRVKYVYTILLRDNGTYGFTLPNQQLMPMVQETKNLLRDIMTARPRYVKFLYGDDANINTPHLMIVILGFINALIIFF